MATIACQYNKLSATAFPVCCNADCIPQNTIHLFLEEKGVNLLNDYHLIYSHLSEVLHCINNVTIDMLIMTYLACRRAIHSKVIIILTCFKGKM